MKKILISVLSVMAGLNAFAQGTLLFQNVGAGLPGAQQPIFASDGTTKLSGAGFMAELLVGATASSLTSIATQPFATGGLFLGGSKTLAGLAGGTRPFIQVRAWDVSSGTTYAAASIKNASQVFQLGANLGDPSAVPPSTPPPLVGLLSFALVPEPSVIALGLLGLSALFLRRRK